MDESNALIPDSWIETRIYLFRGKKIMLDRDLAELYGVTTKALNQAVRRNLERFPEDFMFELSLNEVEMFKVTNCDLERFGTKRGQNIKYAPLAFTEMGVSMLSSILRSSRAIFVNIQIMRTFTKLREILASHEDLRLKLEDLERRYDANFKVVFDALRRMIAEDETPKPEIGFHETDV